MIQDIWPTLCHPISQGIQEKVKIMISVWISLVWWALETSEWKCQIILELNESFGLEIKNCAYFGKWSQGLLRYSTESEESGCDLYPWRTSISNGSYAVNKSVVTWWWSMLREGKCSPVLWLGLRLWIVNSASISQFFLFLFFFFPFSWDRITRVGWLSDFPSLH